MVCIPGESAQHLSLTRMLDGGVNIETKINGKGACNSKAVYAPAAGHSPANGTGAKGEWVTMDRMTVCEKLIKVSKGDKLGMEAFFDLETHPP